MNKKATNPYEPPNVVGDSASRNDFLDRNALQVAVIVLLAALVFQWCCHLLTALAMFGYMNALQGAPTAKAFDTFVLGFACVGTTALTGVIAGLIGARAILKTLAKSR